MSIGRPRPLAELCSPTIQLIDPKHTAENEFWYIDISAVDNTRKKIASAQYLKGKNASVRARQVIQKNDVLVATTRPNLNAVALVPKQYHGEVCSTGFCVLRVNEELDAEYLFHFVQSPLFLDPLVDLTKGALYPAVTNKQVLAQTIPWVTLENQRQIAARLRAQLAEVEIARQAAEVQLREVKRLTECLKEEASALLETCPRSMLGDVLFGIEAGKSFQTTDTLARTDELGVLKVSAVSWNEFRPDEAKAIEGAYFPDKRHRVRKGDLIISRANTLELVGAVVRVDADYPNRLLSDKTLRLLVDETKVLPDFLLNILKWPEARAHIERNATGTSDSMRNISQKTINSIPVPLLTLKQQSAIVRQQEGANKHLHQVNVAVKQQLADLELLPQKILAQAFASA